MKKTLLVMCCTLMSNIAISQDYVMKPNQAPKSVKEDTQNVYNVDNISKLDLLRALEMLDITISKTEIPRTDKERSFGIVIDEYSKGELIKSNTTGFGNNTYHYWETSDTTVYKDFIDEIILYTKHNKQDSTVWVRVQTYGMSFTMPIKYKPEGKESFYNIRSFKPCEFQYGEKIPIVAIASSWYDENNRNRFCGAVKLSLKEKDTDDLLNHSPNYYIISYIIK